MRSQKTIRRSVALPYELMEDARKSAPAGIRGNFNQIMIASLRMWIELRKRKTFRDDMAQMAQDPEIRRESARIASDFADTDLDGLT